MTTLRNVPENAVILRLEQRKSFRLALWIQDFLAHPLDISGVDLRMVARKNYQDADDNDLGNLITSSSALIENAGMGYASFNIQAEELNWPEGEYQFVIVMVSGGYSSVIVQGLIMMEPNPEFSSMDDTFVFGSNDSQLTILLKESAAITVYAGQALAPGTASFTLVEQAKLSGIEEGAQVNVQPDWTAPDDDPASILNKPAGLVLPDGGAPGEVLGKMSGLDQDYAWMSPPVVGAGNLSATGVTAGKVPLSTGVNTWSWSTPPQAIISVNGSTGVVVLDLGDIADDPGSGRYAVTTAMKAKLDAFSATPNYADLAGKPTLGTAAAAATTDFLPSSGIDASKVISGVLNNARVPTLGALRGYSRGTAAPAGGSDGDVYAQYT